MGPPSRIDDQRMTVWRLFLQAHAALVDALERELVAAHGLPLAHYEVLLHLSRAPGRRMRMRDLASSVLLSRSGLTRLVDRMEAAALVAREHCPDDRRGAYAALTPTGLATLRRATPTHLESVHAYFATHLTDDEVRHLASALSRVLETIGEAF